MVIMAISNSPEEDGGGATSKCFSAIINRLLCAGTRPSDPDHQLPPQLKSTHHHQPANDKVVLPNIESTMPINQTQSSTTPGPSIVARLMGLDPFPEFTSSSSSSSLPKRSRITTLDSILRSRSVNYADHYYVPVPPPHLDFTKQVQAQAQYEAQDPAQHRRVRSLVYFRELPTFLLPQNHYLLVICLDQVDEITKKHELGLKVLRRGKNNSLNKKRDKEEQHKKSCKRREDDLKPKSMPNKIVNIRHSPKPKVHSNPSSNSNGPSTPIKPTIKRKEVLVPPRKRKSSNPKPENSAALELRRPIKVSNSPRSNKYDHPCPNYASRSKEEDQREQKQRQLINASKTNNKPLKTKESDYLIDTLKEICRLAEEDAKMGSIWVARSDLDYEDFEEICFEFERETLQTLLSQVVDELCSSL